MNDSFEDNLFPWEDEQGAAAAEPQTTDAVDPFDANSAPPIPAEVAPDDAADRVHQDEFEAPDAHEAAAPAPQRAAREVAEPATARRSDPHNRQLVRKEYYSISEVADLVGLPAHVLRYWESQFSVLNPSKNRSGNRVYQRKEIRLILLVKQLLYEDKYTVEGAKQRLDQLRRGGSLADATTHALDTQTINGLRDELRTLAELLAGTDAH
jgi:DNA-binding transcriptional MerR regulator